MTSYQAGVSSSLESVLKKATKNVTQNSPILCMTPAYAGVFPLPQIIKDILETVDDLLKWTPEK